MDAASSMSQYGVSGRPMSIASRVVGMRSNKALTMSSRDRGAVRQLVQRRARPIFAKMSASRILWRIHTVTIRTFSLSRRRRGVVEGPGPSTSVECSGGFAKLETRIQGVCAVVRNGLTRRWLGRGREPCVQLIAHFRPELAQRGLGQRYLVL